MTRRVFLLAALLLSGCHSLMGAATGLSRPSGGSDATTECGVEPGCVASR